MANELHIYVDLDVDMVSSKYINCNAKQFDKNTRYLRITCYSENKVYPLSATDHVVYVREGKADGFSVLNLCEIDEQGRIIIQLTEQMLAAQGMNYCDVLIAETGATVVDGEVESNRLLSTMNFCINVIPSPMDTSAIESSYEYNALNDLLERAARDYTYIITEAGAYAAAAEASAERAAESVGEIGTAVSDAQGYANAASQSATNAASSASAASTSASNASTSASNAATSETNAASSASNASTSETNAHQSEVNAASSASDASDSATAASGSATSAANSASDASDDAELARQWAVGLSGSGQAQPSDTNNAYYWAQVAASAASGGLKPLVVQSLPTTNISTSIVYLVPSSDPKTKNIYDEYLNTTGTTSGWELIGSTGIDLSDYAEVSKLSIGFNNGNLQLKYDGTTISQVAIPAGNSKPPVATYDESPALYPHAVDDLIYYNDELYKVTASISVGDSLSINTNITTNTGLEEGQQVFINKLPGGSGGGGGVSTFAALTDVQFNNLQDGQVPVYNAQLGKWVNGESGMRIVQIPQPKTVQGQPKEYTYDGTEQTFEWDSIDADHVVLSGNKQTNAGNYTVTANLKGVNDAWINADGTVSREPKTFTWNIAKATGDFTLSTNSVSALMPDADPTVNVSDKVGDGTISVSSSAIGVVNPSYNEGVITLTKVSAGTATVTVSLAATTNYTAKAKTIAVTLTKANQTFNLSASSVSLTSASPTATVNISNATGDGAFSASSSNTGVATASVSGNVVSITGVTTGSATITVTKAATTNYNALSKTIAVSAVFSVPTTFAVKSAINDIITITDGVNSVTATTGSNGSGNVTLDLGTTAKNYTFTSSVTGYSTTVGLTSSTTEVKVYPDSAAVWYLNSDLKNASSWEVKWHQGTSTQSIVDNTANRTVDFNHTYEVGASAGFVSKQKIDVTNYTKMHTRLSMTKARSGAEDSCFMAWGLVGDNWSSGYPSDAGGKSQNALGYNVTGKNPVPMQDRELDISNFTGEWRLAIDISTGGFRTSVLIEKIWFT